VARRFSFLLLAALLGCGGHNQPAPQTPGPPPAPAPDAGAAVDSGVAPDSGAVDRAAAGETRPGAAPADHLRVLFVGNSYVFVNDLPGRLRRIADTAGAPPSIETAEVTVPGSTLQMHWDRGDPQKRIDEKTWTEVVIQGNSLEPLSQPELFGRYAALLADRAVAAGARPLLYATWARAPGDPAYAEPWSGATPAGMQALLTQAYAQVAGRYPSGVLVKVGDAFRLSLAERPALVLHQADRSHPTLAGTYLAACTFYISLTGKKVPAASEIPPGLTAADAAHLRSIAERSAP
jgi:hypothetical protein